MKLSFWILVFIFVDFIDWFCANDFGSTKIFVKINQSINQLLTNMLFDLIYELHIFLDFRYSSINEFFLVAFAARLYSVLRYESVIHEFDPLLQFRFRPNIWVMKRITTFWIGLMTILGILWDVLLEELSIQVYILNWYLCS